MLKRLLTASSVLVLLLIGMTPAAIAQTQQSSPQSPREIVAPAQISAQDLDNFSRAIYQMLTIEQQFQQNILQVIQQRGFSPARFEEIYRANVQSAGNPTAQANLNISPEEQENFVQVMEEGKQIQEESEERQEQALASLGLNMDRLNEIGSAIKDNPELQQEVRTRLEQLMEQ